MSQSSLDGCMFNLNNLLAVENNINKGRFIRRDESSNKAPDTWEEITVDVPDDLKISTTASKREKNITNNILDENISKVKSKGNEIFHNVHARSLVEELDKNDSNITLKYHQESDNTDKEEFSNLFSLHEKVFTLSASRTNPGPNVIIFEPDTFNCNEEIKVLYNLTVKVIIILKILLDTLRI